MLFAFIHPVVGSQDALFDWQWHGGTSPDVACSHFPSQHASIVWFADLFFPGSASGSSCAGNVSTQSCSQWEVESILNRVSVVFSWSKNAACMISFTAANWVLIVEMLTCMTDPLANKTVSGQFMGTFLFVVSQSFVVQGAK